MKVKVSPGGTVQMNRKVYGPGRILNLSKTEAARLIALGAAEGVEGEGDVGDVVEGADGDGDDEAGGGGKKGKKGEAV